MIEQSQLYVIIDGGASKSRAVIFNHAGEVLGSARRGPSSLNLGIELAWDNIVEAVESALIAGGLKISNLQDAKLLTALAGTRATGRVRAFRELTPSIFPAPPEVITDGYAALVGALEGQSGALIILGTGAVAHALYDDNTMALVGGWSFPVADFGSGAWFGQQVGGATVRWLDLPPPRPSNPMAEALVAKIGDDPLKVQLWFSKARSTEYASLAPIALDAARRGDKDALKLVKTCVDEAQLLIEALEARGKIKRISALGGIAKYLTSELQERFGERWHEAKHDATYGGYLIASGKVPTEKI